jgi:small subunit ribosomal protein S1
LAKKKNLNLFAEDQAAPVESEFEALLNSSTVRARGLAPGDRFRGEILAVTGQEAFVSTGTPTDAILPFTMIRETPKTGDFVEVVVVRAREGEILVKSIHSTGGGGEVDSLEDAFDMEIPVSGSVLEAVKGGFRVKLHGEKAFCPISQMDWRVVNAADYIGKSYEFIITKYERGRDLVVSRRKVLELERANAEGEFLRTVEVGTVLSGTIFRIEKYGAFARLPDGVEGLIPISELSWGRINHPQEVVNLEQNVQVKVINVTEDGGRLKVSLSVKQGGSVMDPWATIESDFPVGTNIEGWVEHQENFGLFVTIASGVTGLLPRSSWRDAADGAQYENKRKGDRLKVRVERIDSDARKMSLGPPRDEDDETWRNHASSAGQLGTLADLLKGIKGK